MSPVGQSLAVVAGELGVGIESLRKWNVQHDIDDGEREEVLELRRELFRVEQERDLFNRAAVFFARETKNP